MGKIEITSLEQLLALDPSKDFLIRGVPSDIGYDEGGAVLSFYVNNIHLFDANSRTQESAVKMSELLRSSRMNREILVSIWNEVKIFSEHSRNKYDTLYTVNYIDFHPKPTDSI